MQSGKAGSWQGDWHLWLAQSGEVSCWGTSNVAAHAVTGQTTVQAARSCVCIMC